MSFGVLLTAYRRRADLSCGRLAHDARVDTTYISRMESGQREAPRPDILRRLMDALALDLTERQHFALVAVGLVDAAETIDSIQHTTTMRAANAILAACPCSGCTAQREALERAV
jgi:transcriptional regulator with XRE-family HTH domain